jgi:hypothetical protein
MNPTCLYIAALISGQGQQYRHNVQQFEIASRELIRVGASRRFYHPACHHVYHRAFRRAARRDDDRQGSDQFPVLSQWASLGRSWDERIRRILGRMIGD